MQSNPEPPRSELYNITHPEQNRLNCSDISSIFIISEPIPPSLSIGLPIPLAMLKTEPPEVLLPVPGDMSTIEANRNIKP